MRAAVLEEFKHPLILKDVEQPKAGSQEVLIQVEACGLCHSDLHVADGEWPQMVPITKKPLILGHEIVGRVVAKGEKVADLEIGDRVGVPWLYWSCGVCDFCVEGNENLCSQQKITGVTVDGGYAEYINAPASHALKIPQNLDSAEAAPLFCAGVTVYRAIKHAQIKPGQRLAVFGIGGLGHLAVQIGHGLGAEVIALDVSEEKLAQAKSLGASSTLNAASKEAIKELRRIGGAHVALVASAAKAAYDQAFAGLRASGTILVVGLPAEPIGFPPILMAAKEVRVRASAVGTRQDLQEILAMAAAGKVHCKVASHPLEEVNSLMEQLRQGKVSGRVVLTPHH
jgi:alcohol dehydrogenase, propanol-preferring